MSILYRDSEPDRIIYNLNERLYALYLTENIPTLSILYKTQ